ncbi:MAG: SDR family NAD(P)-dependent oxidoreductase [Alphaproteobacteria bacterium]|nr:SDR family NAD(P)-dependent oxidoreductase [Alphaproteobacteria bacterium]
MRIKGRRILVTGAASGIGRAVAAMFIAEGAGVAMLDRDAARLEAEAARLGAPSFVCDVSEETAVDVAVRAAAEALGGLDGVVNAAGIDLMRPFGDMTLAEWRRVMAVDLDGPFLVCAAALPALRRAGFGTIVNIASGAALRPLENRTAYCAAKAGLVMFSKTLSVDLAPDHIRVNAICPGIIDTPMFRSSFEQAEDPTAEFAKIMDRYLIKRTGVPDDIAAAALFLTSAESAYMTGTAIAVDGGRTFH